MYLQPLSTKLPLGPWSEPCHPTRFRWLHVGQVLAAIRRARNIGPPDLAARLELFLLSLTNHDRHTSP